MLLMFEGLKPSLTRSTSGREEMRDRVVQKLFLIPQDSDEKKRFCFSIASSVRKKSLPTERESVQLQGEEKKDALCV